MSQPTATSPAQGLALAVCLIAATLWAAGTLGLEVTLFVGGDLHTLSTLTLVGWIVLGVAALILWRLDSGGCLPEYVREPAHFPVLLAGLVLLGAVMPALLFRPDSDDSYYLPNVIYALAHPHALISEEIRGLASAPLEPFRSRHWATSAAYDYLSASLAYWTGLPVLDIRYFWLPALGGSVLVSGCFLLMREVTEQDADALLATFALIGFYLILRESHRDPGNFAFLRLFQAKAVVMTAVLPVFAALLYRFLRKPKALTGVSIAALVTGAAGMTTSAVFLIGAVAAGVISGAVAATPHQARQVLIRAVIAGLLCAPLMMPLLRALTDTLPLGLDSPANRGWPTTFRGHFQMLGQSTWLLLGLGCTITLVGAANSARRFVLGWTGAVVILFANPVSSQILIDLVLGPNTYWRIFYALPWVPILGLSVVILRRGLSERVAVRIGPAIAILIVVAFAGSSALTVRQSGIEGVWPPAWKLDPALQRAAQNVSAAAPDGPMLAPPELSGYIPLLSGNQPQLRIQAVGLEVWALAAGHYDMAERRIRASAALIGDERANGGSSELRHSNGPVQASPTPIEALVEVVSETRPASVIVRQQATTRHEVAEALGRLGYGASAEASGYSIWTQTAN